MQILKFKFISVKKNSLKCWESKMFQKRSFSLQIFLVSIVLNNVLIMLKLQSLIWQQKILTYQKPLVKFSLKISLYSNAKIASQRELFSKPQACEFFRTSHIGSIEEGYTQKKRHRSSLHCPCCTSYVVLFSTFLKNRMNSSFSSNHPGAVMQSILFFKSSQCKTAIARQGI